MRKVVVFTNLTVDGVMQAPGRRDEDLREGFQYGGWSIPYFDPVMINVATESMDSTGGILLGRRTYEDFYSYWPKQTDNLFTDALNNAQKYVASRTLREPLPWSNSSLLRGEVTEAVARLKEQPGKDLVVLGSGELVQTLMKHNLIDQYKLQIHPLVLGAGRRLFNNGNTFAPLRLVDTKTTTTGVVIATYQVAEAAAGATSTPA
jgi:dihydrofolate reductase